MAIHRFGGEEQGFRNRKALNQVLHSGDAYILRSGGGGGCFSPMERDLAAVGHDVHQGYISPEAPEKYYGAALRPGTLEIDVAASVARRAAIRTQGFPQDGPVMPITGPLEAPAAHHYHGQENLTEEERLVVAMSGR